jgi:hypothetical protein
MDLNDLIRSSVQEVLAESNTGQTGVPSQPAPQPITVNIQGQPVTFRDQADLEAQLNATAEALRQQQAAVPPPAPAPVPQGSRVTDDEGSGFKNDEYIRLMNEDPLKATRYAMNHLIFEGKVDNPEEVLREMLVQQAATRRQLAAYQFREAHREIPLEDPRVLNTLEQVRNNLNLPFSSDGLEAAYALAVQKGMLPDFRQVAANQQQQQQGQQQPQQQQNPYNPYAPPPVYGAPGFPSGPPSPANPYLQAPPSVGRSAQFSNPVTADDIENMSADQLASLLNKLSAAGVK